MDRKVKVKGIILVLSCQKYVHSRLSKFKLKQNDYEGWKVIYVVADLFLEHRYKLENNLLTLKCEDSYIHLLKKLILAIKYVYEIYTIEEGIMRVADDLIINEPGLSDLLMRNKPDYYGQSPKSQNCLTSSHEFKDTLVKTVETNFMVDYYLKNPEDVYNPQHNLKDINFRKYVKIPRIDIYAAGVLYYISNRSCNILIESMEKIKYDIFYSDENTGSYPYIIEDVAVAFILYSNNINFINYKFMYKDEYQDTVVSQVYNMSEKYIAYHTNYCRNLNTITQLIDHLVYINLDEREDRLLTLQNDFLNVIQADKITRFSGIKNKRGAIGCTLSHIACLNMAIENGYDNIMIVEDDAMWNSFEHMPTLNNLMSKEYDVIVLGGAFSEYDKNTFQLKKCQTTTCYIVAKHYYQKLKLNFEEGLRLLILTDDNLYCIDQHWKLLQKVDNWFIIPELIIQKPGFSTIENKFVDYTEYFTSKKIEPMTSQMPILNKALEKKNKKKIITIGLPLVASLLFYGYSYISDGT